MNLKQFEYMTEKLVRDQLALMEIITGKETTFKHPGHDDQSVHGRKGSFEARTPGAKTSLGYGGTEEGYQIQTDSGARVNGYTHNADFPGDKQSETRGELFFVEVPKSQRGQGIGKSLAADALRLMKENGSKTVNISIVSNEGKQLTESLLRNGLISGPIRTSESGKSEYNIGDLGGDS